ncbi:MAG: type II toxin-antitoxin system HicB family antitoxin [Candidatus Methylomirabilia bacterium]
MKFEVIVEQNERGEFVATAVAYPDVRATGRTEPEALALLVKAMELHLNRRNPAAAPGKISPPGP